MNNDNPEEEEHERRWRRVGGAGAVPPLPRKGPSHLACIVGRSFTYNFRQNQWRGSQVSTNSPLATLLPISMSDMLLKSSWSISSLVRSPFPFSLALLKIFRVYYHTSTALNRTVAPHHRHPEEIYNSRPLVQALQRPSGRC